MFRNSFIILLLSSFFLNTVAQVRVSKSINSGWEFFKGDISSSQPSPKWISISIPHTWNKDDVMDDEPGYYRGIAWYKRKLFIPSDWKKKDVYIHFEGVGQVAEVFVNGKSIGKHTGSYNAFNFKLNNYLQFDELANKENEIMVKVDNNFNEDIPPLSADFTFYGGIYRDVYLKVMDKIHFDADNYASTGIFISTPHVSDTKADLNLKGRLTNSGSESRNISITHKIIDKEGAIIKELKKSYTLRANQTIAFSEDVNNITPQLWSIDRPYLYHILSTIADAKSKQVLDEVDNSFGFRWFSFDAEKGFFLNGKHVRLIGASRHQDYRGAGNALSDATHVHDIELLKDMGANFLRIAHYPQDPTILEACDRLGILTSVETPIVNYINESAAFSENARNMHREMIRQNYNHPSLIIWAYMNEVLLRPKYEKNSKEQEAYFGAVTKLARELEAISNTEDPARYTLIPNHGNFDLYKKVQLTDIPKLVGWNLYQGWYSGNFDGFDSFIENHHKQLPSKPLLITEYGADADERIHSLKPVRFDKSIEYATRYHEHYLKAINNRPWVSAAMAWNLADFNAEMRAETMPHMNNKGLLTADRQPKDAYRFYQANLLKKPYLQIAGRDWKMRSGFSESDQDTISVQPMDVFSNQKVVNLIVNGRLIGSSSPVDGIAHFLVPFKNGNNRVVASAEAGGVTITDQTSIDFELLSQNLKSTLVPFKNISVSLGDNRYFYHKQNHELWVPEQPYQKGSWGYVDGEVYKLNNGRQSYGSDKNILGTDLDPIYQTQRTDIKEFKFDVSDGDYELTLHFSELLSATKKDDLLYNLGSSKTKQHFEDRVFNVFVNEKLILSRLSNAEELKSETPFVTKLRISTYKGSGITVRFEPVVGKPILNGIQLRKIY